MPHHQFLIGDVREALATLPDESVHCVVTSPPYFGLRYYGVSGQIGLEGSVQEYVDTMVEVFREVRRVLRPDGTLWLNLGDSYNGSGGAGGDYRARRTKEGQPRFPGRRIDTLKPKDLIGVPWRTALSLQADGWWLRCDVIWSKKAMLPESVTDRPTRSHEYLFLMSRRDRYWYDYGAVREDDRGQDHRRNVIETPEPSGGVLAPHRGIRTCGGRDGRGRNRRSVWELGPEPFSGAHFAVMPTALVEPCILAGCPERTCPTCGAPWVRVVKPTGVVHKREPAHAPNSKPTKVDSTGWAPAREITDAFRPTCTCPDNDGSAPGVVLDPFGGSGTVSLVAKRLGRSSIYVDLNPAYAEMAKRRCREMTAEEQAKMLRKSGGLFGQPHEVTDLPTPKEEARA